MQIIFISVHLIKVEVTQMRGKEEQAFPNVKLGGKIVKEKGRENGELGNDKDISSKQDNK
jgi:hypothetical protein